MLNSLLCFSTVFLFILIIYPFYFYLCNIKEILMFYLLFSFLSLSVCRLVNWEAAVTTRSMLIIIWGLFGLVVHLCSVLPAVRACFCVWNERACFFFNGCYFGKGQGFVMSFFNFFHFKKRVEFWFSYGIISDWSVLRRLTSTIEN